MHNSNNLYFYSYQDGFNCIERNDMKCMFLLAFLSFGGYGRRRRAHKHSEWNSNISFLQRPAQCNRAMHRFQFGMTCRYGTLYIYYMMMII